MRLATVYLGNEEKAGIVTGRGVMPIAAVNAAKGTAWKEEMYELICAQQIPGLTDWYNHGGKEELEQMPGFIPAEIRSLPVTARSFRDRHCLLRQISS